MMTITEFAALFPTVTDLDEAYAEYRGDMAEEAGRELGRITLKGEGDGK